MVPDPLKTAILKELGVRSGPLKAKSDLKDTNRDLKDLECLFLE